MRLGFIAAAMCTALLGLSPEVMAQQHFQASPGLANLRLDLDTEDGAFSSLEMSSCGLNAIRATIAMPRLGYHARWLPVANIIFSKGDSSASFQVGGSREAPHSIWLRFLNKDKSVDLPFKAKLQAGQKIVIAIDWTPTGRITATVAGEALTMELPGGIDSLSFGGSTGEATFQPLSIGRTDAPTSDCPIA